ncbi:MAG: hypothetical protein H0S79_19185 [Anaerolineaceae bacterium]|nr:hypothetical protein [Anaerolineaceae bacterium]
MNRNTHVVIVLLILLASLVSACGPNGDPTEAVGSETVVPTIVQSTATPTLGAPTVLLAVSADANPATLQQLQTSLQELATGSSLTLTVVDSLTADQLTENVKVVVGLGAGIDLAALAPSSPAIQFIAIDQPNAVAGGNLSVIGDAVVEEERQSFMGGYLAALVTSDYKVAGLIPSDILLTAEAQNAYEIGARFYCGLCKSQYPPYNAYPQLMTLPLNSDAAALKNAAETLMNLGVQVVYVHSDLVTPELLGSLADYGIEVVGGKSPDMARSNWVGTVAIDPAPALTAIWGDVIAGIGGQQVPGAIVLLDLESGLLSEGRMRMFDEMKTELESNLVLPET